MYSTVFTWILNQMIFLKPNFEESITARRRLMAHELINVKQIRRCIFIFSSIENQKGRQMHVIICYCKLSQINVRLKCQKGERE